MRSYLGMYKVVIQIILYLVKMGQGHMKIATLELLAVMVTQTLVLFCSGKVKHCKEMSVGVLFLWL